jgi:hypothetical protein
MDWPATFLTFEAPLMASNGDVNEKIVLVLHESSDPVKVMMMRAGKFMFVC